MPKTKVEVYDKDQLIYPFIESDHVTFSNGMKVSEMLDQSISMPTVTHEDLSFKVGVGDQDVSSAIVDSSVSEMTIKGKTYQNILPEPSTHVLTNNKEMFKVSEGLDPNVEIVDGVSKSAILKGQTLVNIRGKAVDTKADFIDYEVYGLQNNTTYTIVVESTDTNVISVVGFLKDTGNWNCETKPRTQNCKVVLTTTSAKLMGRVRVRKDKKQDTSQAIQIRVMVLEGDYSNVDIPHFEGMTSCKMPVLTTVGKNLFDVRTVKKGYTLASTNGLESENVKRYASDFIYVKGLTDITITNPQRTQNIWGYDENKQPIIKITENAINGNFVISLPSNITYIRIPIATINQDDITDEIIQNNLVQVEAGRQISSYEPYKSNILSTPEEVVLRSLPNGVCDTLNLITGEYVQRIGEVTYTGKDTEGWRESVASYESDDIDSFYTYIHNPQSSVVSKHCHCNLFPVYHNLPSNPTFEYFHILNAGSSQIVIGIKRSKLSSQDLTGIKAWLQANPLTIQYELATPIIKTVDLLSSGNWEKVVYSGASNESWSYRQEYDTTNTYCFKNNRTLTNALLVNQTCPSFSDNLPINGLNVDKHSLHINGQPNVIMKIDKKLINEPTDINLRQYLQQNPITVWYQTSTTADSTQVKQPIFFKDGHIQLSSGADNSLIPTLDYQAKTSNSYVMDLMKTNTKYTMKAKSANGTFTIDGTSYGAGTNGTFTTPSSMTNKLLVMSNKTNEEVMILEGDVVSKTIPYFKGIKSAFEGEDKIEVLSTGKNLFDNSRVNNYLAEYLDNGYVKATGGKQGDIFAEQKAKPFIKPNTKYTITVDIIENTMTGKFEIQYSGDNRTSLKTSFYIDSGFVGKISKTCDSKEVIENELVLVPKVIAQNTSGHVIFRIIVEETSTPTSYEPHKSNSTKIPLSSPLRSLPNGICDELIIDRMKNKATLIQKVGYSVINSEFAKNAGNWGNTKDTDPCWGFHCGNYVQGSFKLNEHNSINDKLPIKEMATTGDPLMGYYQSNPHIAVRRVEACNLTMAREWLDRNPINFYYQLATPVVTEVDLEGFPYIYKDGHIFLNSEIVPTTEIIYSVNQCQQISASNEDIIRHEKELTYLQKLIAQYVQVDYESVLLSLKV